MLYPYADWLVDFNRRHAGMIHRNQPAARNAAVIVETRPLWFLPMVIRNHVHFLGPGWNLYVFAGEQSFDYVRSQLTGWDVHIEKLVGVNHLPVEAYNHVLTQAQFWQTFDEERVLVFQSDSLLTSRDIGSFLEFDYVGAPCLRADESYVANGGLSLRSKQAMLTCLERVSRRDGEAEDVYYTRAVREIGGRMPDLETATRFAVETLYTSHPVGVHGTDKCYHPIAIAQRIVAGIVD